MTGIFEAQAIKDITEFRDEIAQLIRLRDMVKSCKCHMVDLCGSAHDLEDAICALDRELVSRGVGTLPSETKP